MIKLDIINEVVNRTGITKTKAEQAVETVFEAMKKSLEKEFGCPVFVCNDVDAGVYGARMPAERKQPLRFHLFNCDIEGDAFVGLLSFGDFGIHGGGHNDSMHDRS